MRLMYAGVLVTVTGRVWMSAGYCGSVGHIQVSYLRYTMSVDSAMRTEKAAVLSHGLCDDLQNLVADFNAARPGSCSAHFGY